METSGRSEAISARHAELEREIEVEMKRPLPDTARLAELKKAKLRLKDELHHPAKTAN